MNGNGLIRWSTESWVLLKDMKESNPAEVVKFV